MKIIQVTASGDGKNRDLLSKSKIYVALVTPSFFRNANCIGEMRDAYALDKDMIALFKEGTSVPIDFYCFNWKMILNFSNDDEFKECSKRLMEFASR